MGAEDGENNTIADYVPDDIREKLTSNDSGKTFNIELDEKAVEENNTKLRETETYKELRLQFQEGKLSEQDIVEIYINPKTSLVYNVFETTRNRKGNVIPAIRQRGFISSDRPAAELLLNDITSGKIERGTLTWHATEEDFVKAKKEREGRVEFKELPQNKLRDFLCQEYVKGMSTGEMEKQFKFEQNLHQATKSFIKDVKSGFDPAAELMTRILLVKDIKQADLNSDDWKNGSEKFLEATRNVWQDFYYSGKWHYDNNKKEYVLSDETDLDAKTSLFLLKLAKMDGALNAKPLPPGKHEKGATTIDGGLLAGVKVEKDGTVVIDNHQRGRGYETSSAKILFNLLKSTGALKETAPLRSLVEMTVDDDNARLITNKEQFNKSDRTLRGLHRFFDAQALFNFFQDQWEREKAHFGTGKVEDAGRKFYAKMLDHNIAGDIPETERDLAKSRNMKTWGLIEGAANQQRTIKRADKILFSKSEQELYDEGRLINTRLGRAVVNIEGMNDARFLGGHDTVKADPRGFELYISYDPANESILINTSNSKIDLSVDLKDLLEKYPQLVSVRGALVVKPRNGEPLGLTFQELLTDLAGRDFIPQGQIKEFLEHGLPSKTEKREKPGRKNGDKTETKSKLADTSERKITKEEKLLVEKLEALLKEEETAVRQWWENELKSDDYKNLPEERRVEKLEEVVTKTMNEARKLVYNEYGLTLPSSVNS